MILYRVPHRRFRWQAMTTRVVLAAFQSVFALIANAHDWYISGLETGRVQCKALWLAAFTAATVFLLFFVFYANMPYQLMRMYKLLSIGAVFSLLLSETRKRRRFLFYGGIAIGLTLSLTPQGWAIALATVIANAVGAFFGEVINHDLRREEK